MTQLKNKNLPSVGSRALGKKPPYIDTASVVCSILCGEGGCEGYCGDRFDSTEKVRQIEIHYRQALLEAADELERIGHYECQEYPSSKEECSGCELVKKLRISAGVDEK